MKTTLYRSLSKCFHSKNILDMRLHAVYGKRTQYFQSVDRSALPIDDQAVLYIHWPYCSKRCTYCNFNKYISRNVDNERMTKCLTKETQTLIEYSRVSRINSIFFGGGTPSLATPRTIAKVIETVTKTTRLHGNAEVTLEVNPTHLETGKLRDFQSAGVNRVSIGVQALNDSDLKLLGREHNTQDSIRCIEEARNLFPGRVSIDVIFGRPGQTLGSWISELQKILAVSDQHISLYQLTLERGTQLFKWVQNGLIELPDEDTMADMYLEAVKTLEKHGFKQYEVSNFAKNGATSDHNTAYWTGQQYIGVGPGAHGRFVPRGLECCRREARIQTLEPIPWMFEVERDGHATRKVVEQTNIDIFKELVALGLRTTEGLTHKTWSLRCPGHSLWSVFEGPAIVSLVQQQFLILDDRGLRTTRKGMAVLDAMLPDLILAIENKFHDSIPDHLYTDCDSRDNYTQTDSRDNVKSVGQQENNQSR